MPTCALIALNVNNLGKFDDYSTCAAAVCCIYRILSIPSLSCAGRVAPLMATSHPSLRRALRVCPRACKTRYPAICFMAEGESALSGASGPEAPVRVFVRNTVPTRRVVLLAGLSILLKL